MNIRYGYARVSSREQNTNRQLVALKNAGVEGSNVFIDKQSGKDFDRPQYRKLLRKLKPGDELFVMSIDRLGRNYEEILNQWNLLTENKRVNIIVIDMPLLDTRQRIDGLTGLFLSNIVLQILSYVAQVERENIRKRQAEGIAVAKANGVQFGRKSIEKPKDFMEQVTEMQKQGLSRINIRLQTGMDSTACKRSQMRFWQPVSTLLLSQKRASSQPMKNYTPQREAPRQTFIPISALSLRI